MGGEVRRGDATDESVKRNVRKGVRGGGQAIETREGAKKSFFVLL